MKNAILLTLALCLCVTTYAQTSLIGTLVDTDGAPVENAFVNIKGSFLSVDSDQEGRFAFEHLLPGEYTISISRMGFKEHQEPATVLAGQSTNLRITLAIEAISAEEVVVLGLRANKEMPIAYTDISDEDLAEINLGMDLPELLNTTPSLYFSSDAGNGVGYTYLRLRGSDQTNINVMVNGIPLNDSESQGVFWVNMPDLASSTQSIQIQRGVGTSTNGAGAFGGSLNILTDGASMEPYGEVGLGMGSFNTQKYNAKFGTGLINNRWTLDGRLSKISSDGYIDRSASDLESYYLAGGFTNGKTSLRAVTFGGREITQQAWYGSPEGVLTGDDDLAVNWGFDNGLTAEQALALPDADRTYNYYTYDQEVDNYGQDHYQLHIDRQLSKGITVNASGHYTKGQGFFEQYQSQDNFLHDTQLSAYGISDLIIGGDTISSSDLVRRRWLDNDFYGFISSVHVDRGPLNLWVGGGWNRYEGDHFGEVIWAQFASDSDIRERYYDNTSIKTDANVYAKATYEIRQGLSLFGDLQARQIDYSMDGEFFDRDNFDDSFNFNFFNPKAGVNYQVRQRHRMFASYAVANKEPNRDDLLDSDINNRPRPQRLEDLEIGYSYQAKTIAVDVVLYNMTYTDQLIPTGELNDVGERIRSNVDDSYRRGVELGVTWLPIRGAEWSFNLAFSENKILDYVDLDLPDTDSFEPELGTTDIAYSPDVIGSSSLSYEIIGEGSSGSSRLKATFFSKYVGEQFLDNTSNEDKMIEDFLVHDLRFNYTIGGKRLKGLDFTFMIRNIFNELYVSNGYTYRYFVENELDPSMLDQPSHTEVTFNAFSPQATRNIMTGLTLRF